MNVLAARLHGTSMRHPAMADSASGRTDGAEIPYAGLRLWGRLCGYTRPVTAAGLVLVRIQAQIQSAEKQNRKRDDICQQASQ